MCVYLSERIEYSMNPQNRNGALAATFVQNITLVHAAATVVAISSLAYNVFGKGPVVNCFYFVNQLLSSDGTACALFVVSFMAAFAVYVTNTTRSKYVYKLPLLLVIVCYIISRNSIVKYTGLGSNNIGNVAYTLLAMMTPTAFYWKQPRKAPASWSVLFRNTTCHYDPSLKHLAFNIEKNCIFDAITSMGATAVSNESQTTFTWAHFLGTVPCEENTDTQYRAAMGHYIMSMQRHFMCGYFGYLIGWFAAMMVEVYKTSITCQTNPKINAKDMGRVTRERALDNVCALWKWDTEAKVVHLQEFRLTTCMALSTVLTWAWVKKDIADVPELSTRVAWFSSFDHAAYTMCKLLVSDPFVWFGVYYVLILLLGSKAPDQEPVLDEEDDSDEDYLPPPWQIEEDFADAHEEGRIEHQNEDDTDDDDDDQHYLDSDNESDPEEWEGVDENEIWELEDEIDPCDYSKGPYYSEFFPPQKKMVLFKWRYFLRPRQ